jgi:hypothetical protein
MFQRRNIHVCREKLGKSVLIKKKFCKELSILTCVLYVCTRTKLKNYNSQSLLSCCIDFYSHISIIIIIIIIIIH